MSLELLGWNATWADRFAPFADAGCLPGRVGAEHKELYQIHTKTGEVTARVSGRLRHEARGRADYPAVGDWVALQETGDPLTVIQGVVERSNRFSRKLPGRENDEQIIAANLDTLFLVTSLNRDLNPRRIERYLAALASQQVQPVIILNKSDLADCPDAEARRLEATIPGVPVRAVSAHTGDGFDALEEYLRPGRTVALVGSSGVGKSTLVNRLLGEDRLAALPIREDDDRGRHTTTGRELFVLPGGSLLIDNPGMRELQLWDEAADLDGAFGDIADLAGLCRFRDCRHESEPGCAVRRAVADGTMSAARMENHQKLQRELSYLEAQRDPDAERERKEHVKRLTRTYGKIQRQNRRR